MQKSRYFLKLAYNGAAFHGWQYQENAFTVQEAVQNALSTLFKYPMPVTGCGRTDTGVHAQVFYAHFHADEWPFDTQKFLFKLNALVGESIVVYDVFPVPLDCHARFSASEREYQYKISQVKNPFSKSLTHFVPQALDLSAMNQASEYLLTVTDFASFCKAHSGAKTTLCQIMFCQWEQKQDALIFTIRANRFLRNMVRSIVGTLIDVGKHRINFTEFKTVVQSGKRSFAGESVPAYGLFLTDVVYPSLNEQK